MSRRAVVVGLAALLLGGGALFVAAAINEVVGLARGFTRVVRAPRSPVIPSLPRASSPRPAAGSAPPAAERSDAPPERGLRITVALTNQDLARALGGDLVTAGDWLAHRRGVACRMTGGRVELSTANELSLLGIPILRYPGFSAWELTVVDRELGIRLHALRVFGLPVPGASWLPLLLGSGRDGFVVLPARGRYALDRVEVTEGRLVVEGRVGRGAARPSARPRISAA